SFQYRRQTWVDPIRGEDVETHMKQATTIEERALVDLCRTLVAEPSLPGHEAGVAGQTTRALGELDYDEVRTDDFGNVIAVRHAPQGKGTILFDAHIDTVSPGNTEHWSNDPYTVTESDGLLTG